MAKDKTNRKGCEKVLSTEIVCQSTSDWSDGRSYRQLSWSNSQHHSKFWWNSPSLIARRAYCVGTSNKIMCVCSFVSLFVSPSVTAILGPRKCRYRSRMVKIGGPKVTSWFVSNSGSDLNWRSNWVEWRFGLCSWRNPFGRPCSAGQF